MNSKPTKKQLEFLDWELGTFFHFGIRTYYEGHKNWDLKPMDLSVFNPIQLDCSQWIESIKKAGAKYAIFVCKHHDGFANWPSKYTEYSVSNTPWKAGKGDIVREFVDACRKYNIKVGLYYSPAEFGSVKRDSKEYDDYFINQISELLTNYGKIDYLWFDGCGSENHHYDEKRIIKEIRTLQPEILIFNMWDPDVRWIGNEYGIAPVDYKNNISSLELSENQSNEEIVFMPAECDCRIRQDNWFYSDYDFNTLKSPDELMGLYYNSVGHGCNLLINIAPNWEGVLPKTDVDNFIAFGNKIKSRAENVLQTKIEKDKNIFKIRLKTPGLVNQIELSENLEDGEKITGFRVYCSYYDRLFCLFEGKSIGHKKICTFPVVYSEEIIVEILNTEDNYDLETIKLYHEE